MIQDPKLNQLFKIQQSISIEFYELRSDYLYIAYKIDEYTDNEKNEIVYRTDIEEICQVLKEAGLITDYGNDAPFYFWLQYETETNTERGGEHVQECKTVYGSFADFVEQTRFNNFDAATIASLYELKKIKSN